MESLHNFRHSLKTLSITINDKCRIKVNPSLLAALSDVIFNKGNTNSPMEIHVSDADFPLFKAFFEMLDGNPINFAQYSSTMLKQLHNIFQLKTFDFLFSSISTLDEACSYLLQESASPKDINFKKSILVIGANFSSLSMFQLCSLPLDALFALFSGSVVKFQSEDEKFIFILSLINEDRTRTALLKTVSFISVSSDLMRKCLSLVTFSDINEDIFTALSTRLFFDIVMPDSSSSDSVINELKFIMPEKFKE